MADKPAPKKPKRIGDMIEGGTQITHPGYAAYRREAIAMGEQPLSPAEWARQQKKGK